MTTPHHPPFRPRAGSSVTALFLAALAVSATFGSILGPLQPSPATAQTVPNPNDQPTPATVPGNAGAAADRPTGQVAPPRAISSGTDIVASDPKSAGRTNPLDHLPPKDRSATGGTRRD